MSVTSPSIPFTLSIFDACDAEDGLFTFVGSNWDDEFDELRKKGWIWAKCNCCPSSDPEEVEWAWEKHFEEMQEMGFVVLWVLCRQGGLKDEIFRERG
ncbi:hypothetical protein NU219Hw_g8407t1 [Hortaea werneckii]